MNYPCMFCSKWIAIDRYTSSMLGISCRDCRSDQYLKYKEPDTFDLVRYTIRTRFNDKIYELSIDINSQTAELCLILLGGTPIIMRFADVDAISKINPNNIQDKLKTFLAFQ